MTDEKKHITCTVCPSGCSIDVVIERDRVVSISGNKCKKGYKYARSEVLDPMRVLTTTAAVRNGLFPVIPVKTDIPVPRSAIPGCMDEINSVCVKAPVKMGKKIVRNVAGTGANVVTTRHMPSANSHS